jgi:hypothetical protein
VVELMPIRMDDPRLDFGSAHANLKPAVRVPPGGCACDVRDPKNAGACTCDVLDLPREELEAISIAKMSGRADEVDRLKAASLKRLAQRRAGRKDDMTKTHDELRAVARAHYDAAAPPALVHSDREAMAARLVADGVNVKYPHRDAYVAAMYAMKYDGAPPPVDPVVAPEPSEPDAAEKRRCAQPPRPLFIEPTPPDFGRSK